MKKYMPFTSLILFFALGLSACRAPQQPASPAQNQAAVAEPVSEQQQEVVEEELAASASRYVEYSNAAFEQAADKRRVLFFYASWCSTCRPADANFQQNIESIPEDVLLLRVNYNDNDTDNDEKALAAVYGITYQHTFVQVDAEGNEVSKWNGGQINELLANLK